MKQYLTLIILISLCGPLIAMDNSQQSHTLPTTIGDYWGSICGLELWICEHMAHTSTGTFISKPYYKHNERILDDWLFKHPGALSMTFAEAASRYPDVFTRLPEKPEPALRAHYLHQVLKDIFQRRLTEYRKYEHDAQRGSKAHPTGKYR